MNEANCETQIWKLFPELFDYQSEELSADDLIERVRLRFPSALKFEDGRIRTAISTLAKKYARCPIKSCRPEYGRNGYRLRDSFDKEHPPSTKKRGRPIGSQSTSSRQRHPPFDLASVYAQLKKESRGKSAVSVIKGREIRAAISETQQRSVIVRIERDGGSELELPKRDYFEGEFSRTRGELVFHQRNDGSGDGHFTPLFAAVIGWFVSDAHRAGIKAGEFIDAVERELKRIERGPNKNCLGEEEQRGLIGELWFLANVAITKPGNAEAAIKAWHGQEGSPIDFWFDGGCVAMKTSLDQAKIIQISSVRQLDTQGIKKLFLAHLRLTPHSGGKGGMTLPEYVEAVREKLPERSVKIFDEKLNKSQLDEYGKGRRYRGQDWRHYTDRYYADHGALAYYRVPTDRDSSKSKRFPKFTQKELEDRGIEVAKYSIEIARLGKAIDRELVKKWVSPSLPS